MSDATFEGLHGYRSSHHSWFPIKVCNIHISANVLPPAVCICVLSSFVYRWRIYRWPHLCCSHAGRGSILWLVITLRIKVKVKVTLEQATKAQREVEVYLYSFFNFVARWGGGQRHAPAALLPGKTRYPLYRRGVGPRTGLDGFGKSRPHRDSIPGSFSPLRVAIPTELSRPRYEWRANLNQFRGAESFLRS